VSAVTIVGNLATAPELRVTPSGRPLARFVLAENSGHRDRATGEWVDDEPTFWPVNVWGDLAENVVETLAKGDRAVVTGRTRTNAWETKPDDGSAPERRSRVEVTADEVGAALRFARARVAKVMRTEPGSASAAKSDDPWTPASPAASQDEPPF
jgi:single-strand DNA-binding protein